MSDYEYDQEVRDFMIAVGKHEMCDAFDTRDTRECLQSLDEGLDNPDVVTKYKSAAKIVNSTLLMGVSDRFLLVSATASNSIF